MNEVMPLSVASDDAAVVLAEVPSPGLVPALGPASAWPPPLMPRTRNATNISAIAATRAIAISPSRGTRRRRRDGAGATEGSLRITLVGSATGAAGPTSGAGATSVAALVRVAGPLSGGPLARYAAARVESHLLLGSWRIRWPIRGASQPARSGCGCGTGSLTIR